MEGEPTETNAENGAEAISAVEKTRAATKAVVSMFDTGSTSFDGILEPYSTNEK